MEDMTTDYYQKSDKLLAERNAGAVTYQVGDFFVMAVQGVGGSDVSLYDSNLENVKNTSYPDMENLTEVLNKFCEDFQFDGIDTLRNRSAEMLNFGTFMQNYHEAFNRRDNSLEIENQWFQNSEDSFAVHILNPTEHNEQLEGRDMTFLKSVGEELNKRNFQCVYTNDLASLKENDPMFYGDTDMAQHFGEALAELQAGDGEKLLTMLQVKSPKMEGLENEMQTGCILSLKIDGEVSNYFMEETGLEKVDFMDLPPKFKEMAVEERKEQFYQEIFEQSLEISDFTNEPVSQFDQTCITILVNSAMEMNPEASRKEILAFVGDNINEGLILPKDFRNMDVSDFVEAISYLEEDKSRLEQFSSIVKEEQSNEAFSLPDTKELLEEMIENPAIAKTIREAYDISVVADGLETPLPFEDMVKINDFATDIWLKYEDTNKVEITDFIGNAISEGEITVNDLENISRRDFFDCLTNGDTQELGGLVADKVEIPENTPSAKRETLPDIVPVQGEDDLFSFTMNTQERVAIHSAVDHQFEHNHDLEQDYRDILRDIIDELDPQGDLWKLYPDDYVFDPSVSVEEKTTLNFTEEQLEVIAESCSEVKLSWDNITNDYYDFFQSIEEKIENKGIGIAEMGVETPENEPRRVAGSYEITDSLVMGGEEIAMGVSDSGSAGTWERNMVADEEKGVVDNWYSGHYFGTKEEAVEDFQQRIEDKLQERETFLGDKSMFSEKNPKNGEKAKAELKEGEKTPRESVLAKLKEIKSQIAPKEDKEQPTKTKPDQTI